MKRRSLALLISPSLPPRGRFIYAQSGATRALAKVCLEATVSRTVNNVTEIASNTSTPMHIITAMYLIGFGNAVSAPRSNSPFSDSEIRSLLKRAIVSPRDAQHPRTKEVACRYRVATV